MRTKIRRRLLVTRRDISACRLVSAAMTHNRIRHRMLAAIADGRVTLRLRGRGEWRWYCKGDAVDSPTARMFNYLTDHSDTLVSTFTACGPRGEDRQAALTDAGRRLLAAWNARHGTVPPRGD